MASKIGSVALMLVADAQGVAKGVGQATQSIAGFFSGIGRYAARTSQFAIGTFVGREMSIGLNKVLEGAKELAKWAAQTAMEYEQAEIAFQVMTGTKKGGTELLGNLQNLAVETPFKASEVISQAKLLKAYGVDTEDLIPVLRQLGDVAAGTGVDIGRLSLAYGQVISKGRFQSSELRQFTEAGVGLSNFAKAAGLTSHQLLANMEAGTASSSIVVKAFQQMTGSGGMFFKLMDKQSQTVKGRFDSFVESVEILVGKIGILVFKSFGVRQFLDDLAKGVQSITITDLGNWFNRAADGLSPLYDGMIGVGRSLGIITGEASKFALSWETVKIALENFVDFAGPAVAKVGMFVQRLSAQIIRLTSNLALPGTEKLMQGHNTFVDSIAKDTESMNKLKEKGGFLGSGFASGFFDQSPENKKRLQDIDYFQKRIERAKEAIVKIDNALQKIDADSSLRSNLTGGLSNLLPSRDEMQKFADDVEWGQRAWVDALEEFQSTVKNRRGAAKMTNSEKRQNAMMAITGGAGFGFGNPIDTKQGLLGGAMVAGMPSDDEMRQEARNKGRIAGETFAKNFDKAMQVVVPGFKETLDNLSGEITKFGKDPSLANFQNTMRSLNIGVMKGVIGMDGGISSAMADRIRVEEFNKLRKFAGLGSDIRNVAPLINSNSQEAFKALNDARGLGGTDIATDIKAIRKAEEETAANTKKQAEELKKQKEFAPLNFSFMGFKIGGG